MYIIFFFPFLIFKVAILKTLSLKMHRQKLFEWLHKQTETQSRLTWPAPCFRRFLVITTWRFGDWTCDSSSQPKFFLHLLMKNVLRTVSKKNPKFLNRGADCHRSSWEKKNRCTVALAMAACFVCLVITAMETWSSARSSSLEKLAEFVPFFTKLISSFYRKHTELSAHYRPA